MIPYDFNYQFPQGAYLVVLSFLALFFLWKLFNYRKKIQFPSELVHPSSSIIFTIKAIFSGVVIALCAIALMQPVGNGHYPKGKLPTKFQNLGSQPIELKRKAHDIIFLIDASASMAIQDTRLQKSRLEYAKAISDEIISTLKGETVSLYAFTSKVTELSPLTLDYIYVRISLKQIEINEGDIPGTDIKEALTDIRQRYFAQGLDQESNRLRTVILLSDGGDTAIDALPAAEQQKGIAKVAGLVEDAAQYHLRVYTIGMGSAEGGVVPDVSYEGKSVNSKLESGLLESIAKNGRGSYFDSNFYTPGELAKAISDNMAQDPPYYEKNPREIQDSLLQSLLGSTKLIYDRYYQVPIGLALIALAFVVFFPGLLKKNLFLVIFLMLPLNAQDPAEMLHAKRYTEAGMYEQARAIYERMLLFPLSDYQEIVIRYNIGTTYLLENSWEQAIKQLNGVNSKLDSIQPMSAPWKFLQTRIYRNLALAYYKKALSISSKNPLQALKELSQALIVNSQIPVEQMEPLQSEIKRSMAYERTSRDLNQDEDPLQPFLRLLDGLDNSLEGLQFLARNSMSSQLKSAYSALFLEEQKAWLPEWKEQEKKIKDGSILQLFQEANKSYLQMMKATQNEDIELALQAANSAETVLDSFLVELAGGNVVKVRLEQLINTYQRLLEHRKWSEESVDKINQLYESFKEVEGYSGFQTELEKSQQGFQDSVKMRQDDQIPLANLLAQDGLQWIELALARTLRPVNTLHALTTLIQQQRHAENQLKSYLEIKNSPRFLSKWLEIVIASQAEVMQLANLFSLDVYAEQKVNYQKGHCQAIPWATAFPLFDEGRVAAAEANRLLRSSEKLSQILSIQTKAVQEWEKALTEIKNPTTQHSSCYKDESKDAGSTSQLESLTSLLKMESEDRSPSKPTQIHTGVVKPW